jgi:CDP-diacylglycerol--serine O-phosphatidyltransferase
MRSVQPKHLVPNGVTLLNITCGFLAMVSAAEGNITRACFLLFFASMCDLFDGLLARKLQASSKFGMELDSLSDVVSFGVAPAVIVYLSVLRPLGVPGVLAAIAYLLCGALRLARYNVGSGPLSEVTFLGCPIPVAAGYVVSMIMVRDSLSAWTVAAGTVTMAALMVSTVKVPKFRKGGLPAWLLVVMLALGVSFLVHPMGLLWHAWNGWNLVLLVMNYVVLGRRGLLRPASAAEERAA